MAFRAGAGVCLSCCNNMVGIRFCELRGTGGGGIQLSGFVAMGVVNIGGRGTSGTYVMIGEVFAELVGDDVFASLFSGVVQALSEAVSAEAVEDLSSF